MKLCIAALVSAFCIPLAKACLVKKAYGPSERCHIGIPASSTTPIMFHDLATPQVKNDTAVMALAIVV